MNESNASVVIGVVHETFPEEKRVALTPDVLPSLIKSGASILIESGAGTAAGFSDAEFEEKGAKIAANRDDVFAQADVIAQVRSLGANLEAGRSDLDKMRSGQTIIGMMDPLSEPNAAKDLAGKGVNAFALELMPRITRAQSMDILSSMATVAGYKAVLMAANHLPKMFPMMMTAAGTVTPAKVFIVGVGVAGLQAIATAKRLGAVVEAYDVRPAVKDQVKSLGATFVEFDLETEGSEDKGGYAKAQSEEFYQKQQQMMKDVVVRNDVVITTAAIPGRKAPILVTRDMIEGMAPGSVIIDLAAERGGNCEGAEPGQTVDINGVSLMGPLNLSSTIPYHASKMFGKNVATFLKHLIKDGALQLDLEDEITRETLIAQNGDVPHARLRELLGLSTEGSET
ncbi:MAG: Re/Si-specific NAD(P)(+) transhydrogenase subunit alpha [Candidatus Hinthialibacter antarcticus]|nr:Re/Si-specific NAD(P)(+) transhydrogenase subunit alpha [Candidatus Hinthialibacter antarcticus]